MSAIKKGIKKIGKFVKKNWKKILIAVAVVFTAGAALGGLAAMKGAFAAKGLMGGIGATLKAGAAGLGSLATGGGIAGAQAAAGSALGAAAGTTAATGAATAGAAKGAVAAGKTAAATGKAAAATGKTVAATGKAAAATGKAAAATGKAVAATGKTVAAGTKAAVGAKGAAGAAAAGKVGVTTTTNVASNVLGAGSGGGGMVSNAFGLNSGATSTLGRVGSIIGSPGGQVLMQGAIGALQANAAARAEEEQQPLGYWGRGSRDSGGGLSPDQVSWNAGDSQYGSAGSWTSPNGARRLMLDPDLTEQGVG